MINLSEEYKKRIKSQAEQAHDKVAEQQRQTEENARAVNEKRAMELIQTEVKRREDDAKKKATWPTYVDE